MFLDIDIPEGIAYFIANGQEPPEWLLKAAKQAKYNKVILLEQNPNHENDEVRVEDKQKALEISKIIENLYKELGYEVHKVPFVELNKRVQIVKKICGIK